MGNVNNDLDVWDWFSIKPWLRLFNSFDVSAVQLSRPVLDTSSPASHCVWEIQKCPSPRFSQQDTSCNEGDCWPFHGTILCAMNKHFLPPPLFIMHELHRHVVSVLPSSSRVWCIWNACCKCTKVRGKVGQCVELSTEGRDSPLGCVLFVSLVRTHW